MRRAFLLVLMTGFLLAAAGAPIPKSEAVTLPSLPLRFERQPDGTFLGRGTNVRLGLRTDGMSLLLRAGDVPPVRMSLEGSLPDRTLQGEGRFGFSTSYFYGADPAGWHAGLESYRRVLQRGIYPGVDLVVYGTEQHLEFDFRVAASADPDRIRMRWSGLQSIALDRSGDLVLTAADRDLRVAAPRAYQTSTDGRRAAIPCRYRIDPGEPFRVGFELGAYDPSQPLTIDPVLSFSTFLGWDQSDGIAGVTRDDQGNIYLAGVTNSVSLPTSGGFQEEKSTGTDIWIAKLTADKSIAWMTYVGGAGNDDPSNILVGPSGDIYVVGTTGSSNFPTKNAFQEKFAGSTDAFLFKLNATGTAITFSTFLGGSGADVGYAVILGQGQEPVVTGTSRAGGSVAFPITAGAIQFLLAGGNDVFVTRFTADAKGLVFSTFYGGSGNETPGDLLENPDGSIVLDGTTSSSNLPVVNAFQETRAGSSDAFLCQFNADATELDFSTYLGGNGNENGYCLAKDASGQIYVGGDTSSSNFPMVDPIQHSFAGGTDVFIARIAADFSAITASTYFGGAGQDSLRECSLDESGRVVGAGVTGSPDLPLAGAIDSTLNSSDTFVAVFDLDRSLLAFSSFFGGEKNEVLGAMSLAQNDDILIAGLTTSLHFPALHALQDGPGGSGIYRTANAGQAWEASGAGLEDPNIASLYVDPSNSWVYAGTYSKGIYRSKDHGASWENLGPDDRQVLSIAVDPTDSRVIFAGTSAGLERTTDGGENWEMLNDGSKLKFGAFTAVAIDPADHQTIYVGTQGSGVYKSGDGGDRDTWFAQIQGLDDPSGGAKVILAIRVDPHDSDNVYLGTQGAVYKSDNGGNTWSKTSFNSVGAVRGLVIDPADSSILYASGRVGSLSVIARRTIKEGVFEWRAWPMQPSSGTVSSLWVSPIDGSTLFAGTFDQGVLKGTNSGEDWQPTWNPLNSGLGTTQIQAMAVDPQNGNRMYVGYEAGADGFIAEMQPQNVFYFPQIADGTRGRIKFKTAMVFVNTGEATTVHVEFFDSNGDPMVMRFGSNEAGPELLLSLPKGGGTYLQSQADPDLRVGYARITAGPGVDGTAIFTRIDITPNVVLYEAGVPSTRAAGDFVFLLDSLGDNDTGIALVNASEGLSDEPDPAKIELTLRDADGNLIGTSSLDLARGQHRARFISELFPTVREQASEMRGIVAVHSPVPLVALTLRQRDNPDLEFPFEVASLTPFPVMQPSNLGATLYFPQVANGAFGVTQDNQFMTSFFLANPGTLGITTRVTLAFFDSNGDPMGLDIGTGSSVGSIQLNLGPGQFQVLQTTGQGGLQVGYAKLTATNPVIAGTGVFTQHAVLQNQNLFEAGVAATLPRRKFSIFVDSIGAPDTGLALVNTSTEQATVTLRLYDLDFNLLAEQEITLEAGHHLPRYVSQLFTDPDVSEQATEMRGVLTVDSDQPLAAVTLRQKDVQFSVRNPAAVPTLTTFPVIAGVPAP